MKGLIKEYENKLFEHEHNIENLRNKIRFYTKHQLNEEARITRVKLEASEMIVSDFKQLIEALKEFHYG